MTMLLSDDCGLGDVTGLCSIFRKDKLFDLCPRVRHIYETGSSAANVDCGKIIVATHYGTPGGQCDRFPWKPTTGHWHPFFQVAQT